MGSVDVEAKRLCLEKATKILLEDDSADSKIGSRNPEYIESLKALYDLLQTTLSRSLPEVIYSQLHHLRWPTKEYRYQYNDESKSNIDTERIRQTIPLETDLYRAMLLNCLILESITNPPNQEQRSRKRQRRESNNRTCDDSRKIILQRTIDQCRVLLHLLEQLSFEESNTDVSVYENENMWDERIREWTKDSKIDEDEDEDDDSLNILSFTKEQLAAEEQQLLDMAETPIPAANRYNQQQQQRRKQNKEDVTSNKSTNSDATETKQPLKGRLVSSANEASSSQSSVAIHMDKSGILRSIDDANKDSCWWSLTSESVVHGDNNKSSTNIQIINAISIMTAEMTTINLDVGQDGMLWIEQISSFQANTKRLGVSLAESQEEIVKLWTDDEVGTAQSKARELFAKVLRARK